MQAGRTSGQCAGREDIRAVCRQGGHRGSVQARKTLRQYAGREDIGQYAGREYIRAICWQGGQ